MFALAVAELILTIDAFIYLQKENKWWSGTEKARMGFLIFSCARTIFLSSLYVALHCCAVKNLLNTMHTVSTSPLLNAPTCRSRSFHPPYINTTIQIFLVISTILWVISGVLIYQIWQYVECQNNGIANSFDEFKSQVAGGLSLCHEIKIIEIIAWVIAGVSVIAAIPVVLTCFKARKAKRQGRNGGKAAASAV